MAKNKKKKKNPIPSASNLPKNGPEKSTAPAESSVLAEGTDFEKELSSLFEKGTADASFVPDNDTAEAEGLLKTMSSADNEKGTDKNNASAASEFAELFEEEAEKLFEEAPAIPVDIQQSEKNVPEPIRSDKKNKKKNKKAQKQIPAETADVPHDEFVLVPPAEESIPQGEEESPPEEKTVEKSSEPAKPEKQKEQKQKKEQPENVRKKPVDESSSGYLLRLVLVLTIISAVIAGMLAVVNYFTKDIIAGNVLKEKEKAVLSVFPEGDSCKEYTTPDGDTVYFAASGDYVIGYCVNVSPSGYSGDIDMMVGIGADGSVTGIKIVSLSETPGVGTKVNSDSFLSQFIGRTNSEPLAVSENVDGIGGATFSSKAVTAGVSEALAVSFALHEAAEEVGLKVSDSVNVPENVADANDDNGDDILMPDEAGEVDENDTGETEPITETLPPETEDTEPVETESIETIPAETLPPETIPPETVPVQGEIEAPAVSEIEPETEETEETETETEPPAETLPPETEPITETLPPETEPVPEILPPETEPVPEILPPEPETEETEPVETDLPETDDIIIGVEITDDEPEETEEPETEETEETETEKETKKNNSSNRGPIIIR